MKQLAQKAEPFPQLQGFEVAGGENRIQGILEGLDFAPGGGLERG